MSDLGDCYKEWREHKKKVRHKNFLKWVNVMDEIGAIKLTDGVYRLGDWDLYPSKGMARNYRTNKWQRIEKKSKGAEK